MIVYVNALESIGDTLYVSPQIEPILGYTVDEWLEDPKFWQKLIHPDDRGAAVSKIEQANLTGQVFNADYRVRARDGHYVWFHDQAVLVLDAMGRKLHWQGLMSGYHRAQAAGTRVGGNRPDQPGLARDPDRGRNTATFAG